MFDRVLVVQGAEPVKLVFEPLSIVGWLTFLVVQGSSTMHLVVVEVPQVKRTFRVTESPMSLLPAVHQPSLKYLAILFVVQLLLLLNQSLGPRGYLLRLRCVPGVAVRSSISGQ